MSSARWHDILNFLSKTSPRKIWNILKVLTSYQLTKSISKPIQWGVPFNLTVEPTTTCNLKCPECPSGLRSFTRPTGKLDPQQLEQILEQTARDLVYLYFYFQGEPYLHPQFTELVRMAADRNVYTVTSTNAHYLSLEKAEETIHSGLDRIIISIDGATQETYEAYRKGGRLEKVLEGTRNLLAARKRLGKKHPYIIWQFLVVQPNEHEVKRIREMADEFGVDELKLKTAQIYDFENGSPLIPTIDRYSRYRKNGDGKYHFKGKMANHCWKLWHASVVTWDGKVSPCCFDKDAEHVMGDLKEKDLKDIWQSENYHQFREQLSKSRASIDICKNCSEGLNVWES